MVNLDHMDHGILDYTINFMHYKESPYRRSENFNRRVKEESGIYSFSGISFDAYFLTKEY